MPHFCKVVLFVGDFAILSGPQVQFGNVKCFQVQESCDVPDGENVC